MYEIRTTQVFDRICTKEFLNDLEQILEEEKKSLNELKSQESLKSKKIKSSELEIISKKILQEVDSLLGVEGVDRPRIRLEKFFDKTNRWYKLGVSMPVIFSSTCMYRAFSGELPLDTAFLLSGLTFFQGAMIAMMSPEFSACYNPGDHAIILREKRKNKIPFLVAHEYGHHILNTVGKIKDSQYALEEGFCTLLGMQIAEKFAQKDNNPAYLLHNLENSGILLRNASFFIKKYLENQEQTWLPKYRNLLDAAKFVQAWELPGIVSAGKYFAGYSFLKVAEKKQGKTILRDILNEENSNLVI